MKYQKYIGLESNLQISTIRYLDSIGLLCNHSANEIKANAQYYAKRAKMGVKRGFPDVSIFKPTEIYHGLFIELKVGYNKPTDEQYEWLDSLNKEGYLEFWTNSIDELMHVAERYINNETIELTENFRILHK
jgi:hypothetical protein